MPVAPIWIALSLALSVGHGGTMAPGGHLGGPAALSSPAAVASVSQPDQFEFVRRGRRNPFERPSTAPPQLGERLTYHQQIRLVRQAQGLLQQIRAANASGQRAAVLARYDQLLYLKRYRFGIEEIRKQLLGAIQSAQAIVANATTVEAEALLHRIKVAAKAGHAEQALTQYRQLVAITNVERFSDPALRAKMQALRSRANQSAKGLALTWARRVCSTMDDWAAHGRYKQIVAAADDVVAMLKEMPAGVNDAQDETQRLLLEALRKRRDAELQIRFNDEGVVVSAVVYTPALPSAIVNNNVVYEGDRVNGIEVQRIKPGQVVFLYHGQSIGRVLSAAPKPQEKPEPSRRGSAGSKTVAKDL